jgi:hypothetical protein
MSPIQFPDGIAGGIQLVAFAVGMTLLLMYVWPLLQRSVVSRLLTTVRF